ncbi:MAG: bifunctional 4-hydroxy-2-oxoglutarate aldolase/2-dehydro-3-deoxy-phosphogluconate aldolase [Propionibacteriaceae bacterium]|nr:bifunctional 4-hydroxy-2-oxoglutarate aldolase/2-dehydro-3-deoxy-phosphogluconate aldolase [Propionibacteriaceae bacterium]
MSPAETAATDCVLAALTACRLVPVLVVDDPAAALPLAHALVAGGLPVAEVTFRTAAGAAALERMAAVDGLLVGAGTVVTPAQVDRAVDAGARFVVSPGLSRAVVERCIERDTVALPGAVTATEIQAALELGLSTLKFFPAETSGGAAAIKALGGPFPDLKFVPTGGIGPANLASYLAIQSVAAVGGSWMAPRDKIAAGAFAEIEQLTRAAVALAAA